MKRILTFLLMFMLIFSLKIYAATDDDDERVPDYLKIYIDDESVKEGKETDLMRTATLKLKARTFPSSASDSVKWYSTDEDIATVSSSGVVTAVDEGQCRIYVRSSERASRKTYITINVTEYIRYPDKLTLEVEKGTVFETGKSIKFNVKFYPNDVTETRLHWIVIGGNASVNQNGEVEIHNKGKVIVKAYSDDLKCFAEYTFEAKYSETHFEDIGECFNIPDNRCIVFTFDEEVNALSAVNSIFSSSSKDGNGDVTECYITVSGNILKVTPKTVWNKGENYIFIRDSLSDISGVKLNKNMRYKLNVR